MALVTFPDKNTGDTFSGPEATSLKAGVNKLNIDNRPDLLTTTTGQGTTASPYVNADGTAGIKTVINSLVRGTKVRLISAQSTITATSPINKHGLAISADNAGFNQDPNGESEGFHGTKLMPAGVDVFTVDNSDGRRGGVLLERFYVWGDGYAAGHAVLQVNSGLDQPRVRDLNVSNVYAAIRVGSNGALDTIYIDNLNVLNAGYAFLSATQASYFKHFNSACLADLEYSGIALLTNNNIGFTFHDLTVVRCARKNDTAPGGNGAFACGILLRGHNLRVVNSNISETGRDSLGGSQNANAHGIVVEALDCIIANNSIYGNVAGRGIYVRGNRCRIANNSFGGPAVAGVFGAGAVPYTPSAKAYSANLVDIYVEVGVYDTVIDQPGFCNIIDNGNRTIVNGWGRNSGDPRNTDGTTGPWSELAIKPEMVYVLNELTGAIYQFSKYFTNGYRLVDAGTGNPTPGNGSGGGGTGPGPNPSNTLVDDGENIPASRNDIITRGRGVWAYDSVTGVAYANEQGGAADKDYSFTVGNATIVDLLSPKNSSLADNCQVFVNGNHRVDLDFSLRSSSDVPNGVVQSVTGVTLNDIVLVFSAAGRGTLTIQNVIGRTQ